MSATAIKPAMPDHTQLPCEDGTFKKSFQETPQSILLTGAVEPHLAQLHPQGDYALGCDSGIYFRLTDPPLAGCKSPDWFYVPAVFQMLDGQFRRSYVLWQEMVAPLIVIEYASGDGSEERDQTPGAVSSGSMRRGPRAVLRHFRL